jgi:hypothetical protein
MKCPSILFALLTFSSVCCTSAEPEQQAVEKKRQVGVGNPGSREPGDTSKHSELRIRTLDDENIITGEAVYDTVLGDEQPKRGRVVLSIRENGAITGTLSFSNVSVALSGIEEGDSARVWASPTGDGDDGMHRGFLFGQVQNGRYQGVFAISGTGGVPSLEGTWFASGK